jgi:Short C-terminal domain/Phospholipase_D-nuclease N-terminal
MSGYPLLDAFWTMFLFFCWLLWIFIVVWILMDIFRSSDISGWGKAGWTCLVIFLPLVGVLAYEIVHGDHLGASRGYSRRAAAADDAYPPSNGSSSASELSKLSELHTSGVLSDAEFEQAKQKILA